NRLPCLPPSLPAMGGKHLYVSWTAWQAMPSCLTLLTAVSRSLFWRAWWTAGSATPPARRNTTPRAITSMRRNCMTAPLLLPVAGQRQTVVGANNQCPRLRADVVGHDAHRSVAQGHDDPLAQNRLRQSGIAGLLRRLDLELALAVIGEHRRPVVIL